MLCLERGLRERGGEKPALFRFAMFLIISIFVEILANYCLLGGGSRLLSPLSMGLRSVFKNINLSREVD